MLIIIKEAWHAAPASERLLRLRHLLAGRLPVPRIAAGVAVQRRALTPSSTKG
jgi:hypothetical protein